MIRRGLCAQGKGKCPFHGLTSFWGARCPRYYRRRSPCSLEGLCFLFHTPSYLLRTIHCIFLKLILLKSILYPMKVVNCKCAIQWLLANLEGGVAITLIHIVDFSSTPKHCLFGMSVFFQPSSGPSLNCCLSPSVCLTDISQNGMKPDVLFRIWLLPCSLAIWKSIEMAADISILLLFIAERWSKAWTYHILFLHFLGRFPVWGYYACACLRMGTCFHFSRVGSEE